MQEEGWRGMHGGAKRHRGSRLDHSLLRACSQRLSSFYSDGFNFQEAQEVSKGFLRNLLGEEREVTQKWGA